MHLQLKQPQNNPAFVLGNGTSRLAVDPTSLLDLGTVYGCNAQYREYDPHHLIAVDVKMVNEIITAGYHKTHSVWTNPNKGIVSKDNINFFQPHKGWSSGPTALWFAATNKHPEIYILGFDYQGLNGKFNNVYADTFNYKKSSDNATFHGNWLAQTEKVIREFKNIKFYRVVKQDSLLPDKLAFPNLEHILYDSFINMFHLDKINENDQKTII
jgi:hypothetical protein